MGYIEDLRKVVGHRPLIFVGAVTVIVDELGRLLLQQRKFPSGAWGITGGLMELGESTEDVAKREGFEETGLEVDDLKLINVYSGEQNYIKAGNGDEFYVVTVAYFSEKVKGEIIVDTSCLRPSSMSYYRGSWSMNLSYGRNEKSRQFNGHGIMVIELTAFQLL